MKTKHESDGAPTTGTAPPTLRQRMSWRKPVIRPIGQTIYTQTGNTMDPIGEQQQYMPPIISQKRSGLDSAIKIHAISMI